MKASKMREQSDEELQQGLEAARKEVFEMRVKTGTGDTSQQPLRARTLRREVARRLTVLRERALQRSRT
jgi:ribosomal protein L29